MSEHMGFGASLLFSVIGIALVFAVLIVLSLFIRLVSAIIRAVEHTPAAAPAAQSAVVSAPQPQEALIPGSTGDILLHNVDDPTAALVMAIVVDELQLPLNELVFRSIREITQEEANQEIATHEHHTL